MRMQLWCRRQQQYDYVDGKMIMIMLVYVLTEKVCFKMCMLYNTWKPETKKRWIWK